MKILAKALTLVLLVVMVMGLIPSLNTPVSAATTPVLVLDSSTASASILDHILDYPTFSAGGPFTATFEWKCNLSQLSATQPDYYASVQSIGTLNGTMTEQPDPNIHITGNTNWTKVDYTFQNVGTYPMPSANIPGNVFRFRIHDAKGQLYVRNLEIKNAAGQVVYSLNNDAIVQQLIAQMEVSGLTKMDMSELYMIDFDNCPWMANQFDNGKYTSYVILETAAAPTTSSITRPTATSSTTTVTTTKTTTTATTTKATTTATTTKVTTIKPTTVTTTAPTTVQPTTQGNVCASGHKYQNGFCIYCAEPDVNYNPCANGHDFVNGYCAYCLTPDPRTTTTTAAPTTEPATAPTTNVTVNTNDAAGISYDVVIILLVAVIVVQLGIIILLTVKMKGKKS